MNRLQPTIPEGGNPSAFVALFMVKHSHAKANRGTETSKYQERGSLRIIYAEESQRLMLLACVLIPGFLNKSGINTLILVERLLDSRIDICCMDHSPPCPHPPSNEIDSDEHQRGLIWWCSIYSFRVIWALINQDGKELLVLKSSERLFALSVSSHRAKFGISFI